MRSLAHHLVPGRSEDGLTLIELLVACILLAIVLIVMFSILLDAFRSSERTRQRSKAQRNVTLVSEKLESDIRAMRAPNRNPHDEAGIEMMRENFTVSDQFQEIHDIVLANVDRLVFYAVLNSGKETGTTADYNCIEWAVLPDQSIHRRVYPYSKNCADAVAQKNPTTDEEVVPKPDAENATDTNFHDIFAYYVTTVPAGGSMGTCDEKLLQQVPPLGSSQNNADGFSGNPNNQNNGGGGFQQVVAPGLGPQQVDRITAIQLNLRSLVSVKGSRGEDHFTQRLTIPSRQQYEFRYAIGCAE